MSNEDPRYDAEVEAARQAQQHPDSAEADREGAGEDDALEPQAAAADKSADSTTDGADRADTPDMGQVHDANADGVNPTA